MRPPVHLLAAWSLALSLPLASAWGPIAAHAAGPPPQGGRLDWSGFLSRKEVGAAAWTRKNPTWDGRGVVIAVLDTGVDMSVPGLDKLPDGGPKVIEARDFTGEGRVALSSVRKAPGGAIDAHGVKVKGLGALGVTPLADSPYWVGAFDEAAVKNSPVPDMDGDGDTDGRFAIVAFRRAPDGAEVAIVDTDGDGDLADEKIRRSYALEPTPFFFGAEDKRRLAIALTVSLDEREVSLHFDGGSHGSHCAGIAAGHRVEGREGFDGVAPGARVMSLKIGHGGHSGGATVKGSMVEAIRYASAWAMDHETPVVISMSYGIGSETEGASEIDRALDEELAKNRWLLASLSASNEGPGISSVGTPAAATFAFAVAAMITPELANSLRGVKLARPMVFGFSSRGGELDKPDALAPGVAWSSVPAPDGQPVMNGTSMAAPQVAGVMALLVSASLQAKRPWSPGLVRRALRAGARPLPGYTSLDQGAGLVDVEGAWAALGKAPREAQRVLGWKVSTPTPGTPRKSSASYWRVGAGLAGLGAGIGGDGAERERVRFSVTPVFYGDVSDADRARHFDTFTLETDTPWLVLDRRELGLKGDSTGEVAFDLRLDQVAAPGLHVGRVRARQAGLWAFDLPVVVVTPHPFRARWSQRFEGRLEAGEVTRVFVEVPPGASTLNAHLSISKGSGSAWIRPFDPEGRGIWDDELKASTVDRTVGRFVRAGDPLTPGTWELDVIAALDAQPLTFELDVAFAAIDAPAELGLRATEGGATEGTLTLTNRMDQPFRGSIEATVIGHRREREESSTSERIELPLAIAKDVSGIDFDLALTEEVWARMTDVAVDVVDGDGKAVAQEAFGQRLTHLRLEAAPGNYTLRVTAGFMRKDEGREWSVSVTETHTRKAKVALEVEAPDGARYPTLYPGRPVDLSLSGPALGALPEGFQHRVEVALTARDGALWTRFELPVTRE